MKDKKEIQLGLHPATASNKLVKDILFSLIDKKCHQCGGEMTRDDFSVEHIVPWLNSEDPVKLFFDLNNIAFSHKSCNFRAARKRVSKYTEEEKILMQRVYNKRGYTKEKRRERYLRTGR